MIRTHAPPPPSLCSSSCRPMEMLQRKRDEDKHMEEESPFMKYEERGTKIPRDERMRHIYIKMNIE